MDYRPDATESLSKMPRGISLYGSLPAQLADDSSFARRLRDILAVRKRYGIATSVQLDVPDGVQQGDAGHGAPAQRRRAGHRAELLGRRRSPAACISESLLPGSMLVDMFTDEEIGEVDDLHSFPSPWSRTRAGRCWCCAPATIRSTPTRTLNRPSVRG